MVAKDDDDKPAEVPILILENTEEVKRFIEAMNMRDIKNKTKHEMSDAKSHIQVDRASELLKDERCIIR